MIFFWAGALLFSAAPTIGHLYEAAYGLSTALLGMIIMAANVRHD